MAFGIGENPARSVSEHLNSVKYPVWKEQLVSAAMEGEGDVDVINLLKCLPRGKYETKIEVFRDLAEAARRFGSSNVDMEDGANRDRRNIGRDAVEGAHPPLTRHP